MTRLKITADNMLVADDGSGKHVAALKQSYDGGWSVSSDPEPLPVDLPNVTYDTREALVEGLRERGFEVAVEAASREGAGH